MSASVAGSTSKVVVVGAGVGARMIVKALGGNRSIEITVIQPNDFMEVPFSGPLTLSYPEHHAKCITGQGILGVKTVMGVATSTKDGVLTVQGLFGGETQEVAFDYLIAASGFQFPTILTTPGQSFEEREAEIKAFNTAVTGGGDVIVGGGGIIAVELAANMCELINKKKASDSAFKGQVKVIASSTLCGTYPAKYQALAKSQLEKVGCEVILEDRVSSHSAPTLAENGGKDTFELTLKSGKTLSNVSVYMPSFVGKGSNDYLASMEGVLNPTSNLVILDENLKSKTYPKLFALGGCAQLEVKEACLVAPKIEEQANTIAKNIIASIRNTALTVHKEGVPDLTNAALLLMGHHTFAAFVPEVMPGVPACCCRVCGPPCNMMLCPCFGCAVCCGVCDAGLCGDCCCGTPQGKGVAAGQRKFALAGLGFKHGMGFNGLGDAMPPKGQRIVRS